MKIKSNEFCGNPDLVGESVPLERAMLAWNAPWRDVRVGGKRSQIEGERLQVGVCYHPDGGHLAHLSMWVFPNQSIREDPITKKEARQNLVLLKLMVEAWHIACRDGVPLENLHSALSAIPEYRDILSGDFFVAPQGGPHPWATQAKEALQ